MKKSSTKPQLGPSSFPNPKSTVNPGNHGTGRYFASPLMMSEKELTKGAKRILDDTEESGTRRWGEFTIFHYGD